MNGCPSSTLSKRPGTPSSASSPRGDCVVVDPEQAGARQRGECVLDVEAALELEIDPIERVGPELGVVGEAVREGVGPVLGELAAPRIADVDRRRRTPLEEEPPLRLEVVLHRPVQVEVVLRQVRERERAEADALETAELGAVRGRLHRGAAVARVEHPPERPVEVDRLRGRADRRVRLAADPGLDRPEQAGLPAGRAEDRVEHEGGRRLAVRPGDGRDLELVRGTAEEPWRRLRHGEPGVGDHDLGHARGHGVLDDERGGSRLDRPPGQLVPVEPLTAHAEEESTRLDGARVVREIGDLDAEVPDNLARGKGFCDARKLHWAGASVAMSPAATVLPGFLRGGPRGPAPPGGSGSPVGSGARPGASRDVGGISRYWRSKPAICWKAGAATTPPQIDVAGSSTVTRITSRGFLAGTMPTNEAT